MSSLSSDRPKVFISYSHDSPEHLDRVLDLSNRLRAGGVDCQIDQYEGSPPEGWPRWMINQIREADFVLVLCTENYGYRFSGEAEPGKGSGVKWEGAILTQTLYEAEANNTKFIPILFYSPDSAHIPIVLRGATHYELDTEEGYERLYRRLTNQPRILKPELGSLHPMPPLERKQSITQQSASVESHRAHEKPSSGTDGAVAKQLASPLEGSRSQCQKTASHRQVQPRPPIWKVLHAPNGNFTGREDLLCKLRTALTSGQAAARIQAIIGMGGVGKTQLVVKYIYRYAGDYTLVWWVRAEEPATLASDFAGLATEIGLGKLGLAATGTVNQPDVVAAVRHWLEGNPGWLLVFDNASGPDELRNYLPQGGIGHVLVTSRNLVWGGIAQLVRVPVLPMEDAVKFLLGRTQQDDADAAHALATELGELPLVLEQAGAYIEATGRPLPEYLQLLRDERRDGRELSIFERPSTDYPETVATTWELSLRELRVVSSPAADLLNLCAFLAPEDIPRELLTNGVSYLPPDLREMVADPLRWDEAMKAVRRYSLLELTRDGLALRVHRMVQAVARDRLEPRARQDWTEVVVKLMDSAFPEDMQAVESWPRPARLVPHVPLFRITPAPQEENWPRAARLVPHALAAADHGERLKVQAAVVAHLLIGVGRYLRTRAHFSEAQGAFERALAIAKTVYQPDNPEVATVVNDLGRVLHDLHQYPQAQVAFEHALRVHEAAYGPNHPLVARDLNDLGSILLSRGDIEKAISDLRLAVQIDEAAHGPDHPDVARDAGNLGRALQAVGNLQSGREWLARALNINEAWYGPNHPLVASDLSNLGLALKQIGDTSGARACFERSLRMREQMLGTDHPSTVRVRHRLLDLG